MKSIASSFAARPGIRKRLWLVLALLGIVALIGLVVFMVRTEPLYQHRRLTSWMADLPPPTMILIMQPPTRPPTLPWGGRSSGFYVAGPGPSPKEKQAIDAVREIGTNSFPVLKKMLRHEDSALQKKLLALWAKQSLLKIKLFTADQRRSQAYSALMGLGPLAEPVWTDLLLDERVALKTRQNALVVLDHRFPEAAVPPLIAALSAANSAIRTNAALILSTFGTKARAAIPALVKGLDNEDPAGRASFATALRKCEPDTVLNLIRSLKYDSRTFRLGAASSLGLVKQKPELSIPALIQTLDDEDFHLREAAIWSLGEFGAQAQSALPRLVTACEDHNKYVRAAATNALEQIASRATTTAGSK